MFYVYHTIVTNCKQFATIVGYTKNSITFVPLFTIKRTTKWENVS